MVDLTITPASVLRGSNARTEVGTAGATITAGQAVYKADATGLYQLADSNSATAEVRQPTGIALHSAAVNQPLMIAKSGDVTIGATMTAGVAYYLSDTPGGICPVADIGAGEYVCLMGIAKSTTVLTVGIQYPGVSL
jgi:hypothetical protein